MIAFNLIAAFFVISLPLGLATGLAKSRSPLLSALAVGAMLAASLIALTYTFGWAADCWDCSSKVGNGRYVERNVVPLATTTVGAAAVTLTIVAAWLGTRMSDRRLA